MLQNLFPAEEHAGRLIQREELVPGNREGVESHRRLVDEFAGSRVVKPRQVTAEQRDVEVAVAGRRLDLLQHAVDGALVVDRAFEGAADSDRDERRACRVQLTAEVFDVHLTGRMDADDARFDAQDIPELLHGIVRFGRNVKNRRQFGFRLERLAPEVDPVQVAVRPAVGDDAPVAAAETESSGDEVDDFALELIDVQHIPRLFVGAADADQRRIAQTGFKQPLVKSREIRLLVEGVAHLEFLPFDELPGGFGHAPEDGFVRPFLKFHAFHGISSLLNACGERAYYTMPSGKVKLLRSLRAPVPAGSSAGPLLRRNGSAQAAGGNARPAASGLRAVRL